MFKKIPFSLLLFAMAVCQAQTKVSEIFRDHMVLQQQNKVSVWGYDNAKTNIEVIGSWGETETTTTDKNGQWRLNIQTPKAGGPYTLTINGSEKVELKDVMIGEVWLCSGQSNMEMPLKGFKNQPVNNSQEYILNSKNNNIRMFTVGRKPSLTPLETLSGEWRIASPSSTSYFSAAAYFFGKKLEKILNVPVGLIVTCWGASSAEAWTDAETLKQFKTIDISKEFDKVRVQTTPRVLYNGMIHPIIGYNIKGAIWYQGESNKSRASEYTALMNAMITSWRNQWQQGDFPFYTTQIAPFNYGRKANSAYLREAQLKTSQTLKNTGMAVTLDIGDCYAIHPREKKTVGDRLAYWALANDYNVKGVEYSGPIFKSIKLINDNTLEVEFSGSRDGISSFGKPLLGFEVAGEDKVFHKATAVIKKKLNALEVSAKEVSKPVAVRYNFNNCVEASLFSVSGLPASSFRSDDW
ncbi:sialate O-acetylesterase [Wenyingzhuangia sp. IMCC45533]